MSGFKLAISMVGTNANKERYVQSLDELGLLPHCVYCLHVESHEPVTEEVTPGVGERIYNRIEKELERQWVPTEFESFFINHEPRYANGSNWLTQRMRHGFTPEDLAVLDEMGKAIGKHRLPGTIYNLPMQRPDMFGDEWRVIDDENLAAVGTVSEHWEWIFQGLYPSNLAEDRALTYFDLPRHINRAVEGYNRLRVLGKPIVPAIFLRHAWDNANWYGVYFRLLMGLDFTRMVNWTDLRKDFMTTLYIDELRKVAPLLHELIESKSRATTQEVVTND